MRVPSAAAESLVVHIYPLDTGDVRGLCQFVWTGPVGPV